MATIHRHPVPADSYEPDRPLNDLGRDQLKHFIHVAQRLPPAQRVDMPIPSAEDGLAASRFIGAVTERLLSLRGAPLKIVPQPGSKRVRKTGPQAAPGVLPAIAAGYRSKSRKKTSTTAGSPPVTKRKRPRK